MNYPDNTGPNDKSAPWNNVDICGHCDKIIDDCDCEEEREEENEEI